MSSKGKVCITQRPKPNDYPVANQELANYNMSILTYLIFFI